MRLRGHILGAGSTSGVRLVVGRWLRTPMGPFADVMVERADGHRILLAPTEEVEDLIARTYVFDETRVEPVEVTVTGEEWLVESPSLWARFTIGSRLPLGWLLKAVPGPLATNPTWVSALDPVARVLLPGVRTHGTAREGREEYYGATDLHAVTELCGSLDDVALGALAPVEPACRFGFSSTPPTPALTDVVTTLVIH